MVRFFSLIRIIYCHDVIRAKYKLRNRLLIVLPCAFSLLEHSVILTLSLYPTLTKNMLKLLPLHKWDFNNSSGFPSTCFYSFVFKTWSKYRAVKEAAPDTRPGFPVLNQKGLWDSSMKNRRSYNGNLRDDAWTLMLWRLFPVQVQQTLTDWKHSCLTDPLAQFLV